MYAPETTSTAHQISSEILAWLLSRTLHNHSTGTGFRQWHRVRPRVVSVSLGSSNEQAASPADTWVSTPL